MARPSLDLIDCRDLIGVYPQYGSVDKSFKIKKMKNNIQYKIGDFLNPLTVNDLINLDWNINIVEKMKVE